MDANANLEQQRAIIKRLLSEDSEPDAGDAVRLAELAEALDGWIKAGGFLPAAWRRSS